MSQVGHDGLDSSRDDDEDHFQGTRHVYASELEQNNGGTNNQDEALGLKTQLCDPVKETHQT